MNAIASTPLQEIIAKIEKAASQGAHAIILLDIDDTLLLTAWRHARILKEFAADPDIAQRFNGELAKLSRITPAQTRYLIKETARHAGVSHEGLLAELQRFWFERFFKNDYLMEDRPIEGAPGFCHRVLSAGGHLVYLTGRDETMRQGTLAGLQKNGFPVPDDKKIRLLLKPSFDTPDLEFKTQALQTIADQGEMIAGFDNEPVQINLFKDTFPSAAAILVDTRHSGKPIEPYPNILRIKNFN
ncbi:MAG: hypothetical protein HY547_02315 [Elusimicrobia bacterium]|nr:hypothetical protein [Elusimicrobiota bacterium]